MLVVPASGDVQGDRGSCLTEAIVTDVVSCCAAASVTLSRLADHVFGLRRVNRIKGKVVVGVTPTLP